MRMVLAVWALLGLLVTGPALAAELDDPVIDRPLDWQQPPVYMIPNFRDLWREVVIELAAYAKSRKPSFVVLVRGGTDLIIKGKREAEWEDARDPDGRYAIQRAPLGTVFRPYLKAIDGVIFEGLFCGPYKFDKSLAESIKARKELDDEIAAERRRGIYRPPVPQPLGPFSLNPQDEVNRAHAVELQIHADEKRRRALYVIDALRSFDQTIMSIEYCSGAEAGAAQAKAQRDKVVSFVATDGPQLDRLPPGHVPQENANPVLGISAVRNWLPMLRGDRYGTRDQWVTALMGSNYDALLIDVTHRGRDPLTKADLRALHYKNLGAPRLVLADLPIGRAFDSRWYWQKGWGAGNPSFLFAPDSHDLGAFYADLRDPQWKELLGKYIQGIIDTGFDGVVLDELDTYRWFESLMPLK
jgi:cysteinyl-tRNA synthetase, unknown class